MLISDVIPDVEVFLKLEPEELAAKLLFLLRERFNEEMFYPGTLENELWGPPHPVNQEPYPSGKRREIGMAFTEAWAWLGAQGLVVRAPDPNNRNDYRILSRRARRFESEAEFARYVVARMLPKEMLQPKIAEKVWMAFMRGEFDVAAFQAMKVVEVAVREAGRFGNNLIGVPLMREAFAPDKGPLIDTNAERGEQVARMELFAGAIGYFKNPQSHREINLEDAFVAIEIILLANHLLRIVDYLAAARWAREEL